MSGGVFTWGEQTIMTGIDTALGGQSGMYGDMIAPVIAAWASLYMIISGYKALAGKLQTPLEDVLWNLGVMGILLAFVTNAGGWFDAVNTAIDGVRTGFSGNESGIWGQLDSLWTSGQTMAEKLMDADEDYFKFSGQIARCLVWIGVALVALPAAALNLSAEITLKLLIVTGPLFVACLAFGWFRSMFENWMKAIMSSLLAVLFSSISVAVVVNMINAALAQAPAAEAGNIITTGAMIAAAGALGLVTTGLAAKLSMSLAGSGVSAAAAGIIAGGAAIGGAMGIKKAGAGAKAAYGAAGKAGDKLGDASMWVQDKYARTKAMEGMRDASVERMKRLNSPSSKIF